MRIITIPFRPDMRRAALDHKKYCTTRSKVLGSPGDRFELISDDGRAHSFEIAAVRRCNIAYVGTLLYGFEGVSSKQAFVELWNEIHPGRPYAEDSMQGYYVHWFREEDDRFPLLRCESCGEHILPYSERLIYRVPAGIPKQELRPYCCPSCAKKGIL